MANPVQIFQAGDRTDGNGVRRVYTEVDLDQIVSTYNPTIHEAPFLVNHNESAPNFGLIQSIFRVRDKLFAIPHRIATDFSEAVSSGRWPKLSAGFYHPDDPVNPYPGKWALREVSAVQIPGVKGMLSPQFSEVQAVKPEPKSVWIDTPELELRHGLWCFSEAPASPTSASVSPASSSAVQPSADPSPAPASAAPNFAELQQREAALTLREAAFSRREADVTFIEKLVSQGRITGPQMKQRAIALLQAAPTSGVAFSEGSQQQTQYQLLQAFLSDLPVQVQYGEFAASTSQDPGTTGTVTADQIVAKANELVSATPSLTYAEATRKAATALGVGV